MTCSLDQGCLEVIRECGPQIEIRRRLSGKIHLQRKKLFRNDRLGVLLEVLRATHLQNTNRMGSSEILILWQLSITPSAEIHPGVEEMRQGHHEFLILRLMFLLLSKVGHLLREIQRLAKHMMMKDNRRETVKEKGSKGKEGPTVLAQPTWLINGRKSRSRNPKMREMWQVERW
jgi:hypothetical protein